MSWVVGGVGSKGPCPSEGDDLATAWTSSASAHPATSLLALPVVSSLPFPVREQRGTWGEELSQCPGHPALGSYTGGGGYIAHWVPARP